MNKKIIETNQAPKAIGPYSQAIETGGMIYTAGQIGLDPATGEMIAGGLIPETKQVLKNLQAILEAGGSRLDNVVKITIYLQDLGDFPLVNEIYGQTFGESLPARTTIQAGALPKGARVEMDAIAAVG